MKKRAAERIIMEVPVKIGDAIATTRDISRVGIYFKTNGEFKLGGEIHFSIQLDHVLPNKSIKLDCEGRVVRLEDLGDLKGVAAKIDHYNYLH
ncbi:MAG: PilZ domain-containing protein [Deltaproteobacteria bacterium]|jgi:Tfp pilus assembly protein PilZ|nr:PilZ domain-containing protein [Deltaproteobacteria bacterium]MBW2520430.1 PilZ domain-containing protein [Deltaproteobacteria bacterium]